MKPGRLILINVIMGVVLLLIAGAIWYSWNQSYTYVTTNDAAINAPSVPIVAVQPGTLAYLSVAVGQRVTKGQVIGQESAAPTSGAGSSAALAKGGKSGSHGTATSVNILAPVTGRIATINTNPGQAVAAGTPLVTEVNLGQITVVANIPETKIRHVRPGQTASITVDAHPGVAMTGTVMRIQPTTQSFFSLIPTSATAGTYTKVVQRIPVIVSIDTAGYPVLPGESATVRITVH